MTAKRDPPQMNSQRIALLSLFKRTAEQLSKTLIYKSTEKGGAYDYVE